MKEDPFLDELQDALNLPDDLELGTQRRLALLAAADAYDRQSAPEVTNVVAFHRTPPLEQQAFDWLAGEGLASRELLQGMATSSALLEDLESDHRFIRGLRQSLRTPVVAATRATRRRPVTSFAVAAAVLLLAALLGAWQGPALPFSGGTASTSGSGGGGKGPSHHAPVAIPDDPGSGGGFVSNGPSNPSVPMAGGAAGPVRGAIPDHVFLAASIPPQIETGGGCSLAASDPNWSAPVSLSQAASDDDLGGLAMWQAPERGGSSDRAALAANLLAEKSGYLSAASMDGRFGTEMFSVRNPGDMNLSIPEPGGAMPVMFGFLVLLLHRWRRREPRTASPIRS